jgi:hypothetical protein
MLLCAAVYKTQCLVEKTDHLTHPGPRRGSRDCPDSVILSNSKDMFRSICSSAMVFSVFCMDIMLMPQCARCSDCRAHQEGEGPPPTDF